MQPVALTHATVVDVQAGTLLPDRTITIRGDQIDAVGPSGSVMIPDGVRVVDATGEYVIPGLSDMHVHFGRGGGLPNSPQSVERVLRQFLFYGVTTILNLGAYGGRADQIVDLRRRRAEGRILAPTIYATGGLLTVPSSHPINHWAVPDGADRETYDWSRRGVWVVRTPTEVRDVVRRMAAAGMDGIKVVIESEVLAGSPPFEEGSQMPPEMVRAAVEEASRYGLPVFAHATDPDEMEEAVEAGVHAVVHLGSPPPGAQLLEAMRQRDIYLVPTLSVYIPADMWGDPSETLTDPFLTKGVERRLIDTILGSPMAPTAPPSDDEWAWRRDRLRPVKTARDIGVKLTGGSDAPAGVNFHGYSMHHELALMVEAGLTPAEALLAATGRAAELLGKTDVFGTIAPGLRADLVVLDANPLEDIHNTRKIRGVVTSGRYLDRAALDALLPHMASADDAGRP